MARNMTIMLLMMHHFRTFKKGSTSKQKPMLMFSGTGSNTTIINSSIDTDREGRLTTLLLLYSVLSSFTSHGLRHLIDCTYFCSNTNFER